VIDMCSSSHKSCEPWYGALMVLEIDILNPCPFGRVRRYTAPTCLLNCPRRFYMVRVGMCQYY
jgi:hypothetical protein